MNNRASCHASCRASCRTSCRTSTFAGTTPLIRAAVIVATIISAAAVSNVAQAQVQKATPVPRAQAAERIVLRAARLIDGNGGGIITNAAVSIEGDRIVAVGTAAQVPVPAGARVIDLGDATLLPGFIDVHTHIIGRPLADPASDLAVVKDYDAYAAIVGVDNARKTLMAGFTSIRVVGAPNFDDMALRQAIKDGVVPGPRMQNAGHAFGITGGHCDENGYKPGLEDSDYRTGSADGADEGRKAVRYQVKYGADVIKICATGGVLSEGDAVGATQYTLEEMQAIVSEARKLERKVAAHAHGTEGIKLAVQAGVASIEHGSFLDEEGARLMVQHGTYLVPTLSAGEAVENVIKSGRLTGMRAEKGLVALAAIKNAIRLAVKMNVPIALGTDAGVGAHGANAREFRLMVEWGGMTPAQALVAGTSSAAKLLGWEKNVGSLTTGKWADIVAVPGNPLTDITVTERPTFVMKGGVVVKGPVGASRVE